MKVEKKGNETFIVLSEAFDSRPKLLFLIYFIAFFIVSVYCFVLMFFNEYSLENFLLVVPGLISLIVSIRFANKSIEKEYLIIEGNLLQIVRQDLLNKTVQNFDIRKIENFRSLEKKKLTPHQLKGDSFDYFGFDTEQKAIDEMHGEFRIEFDYAGGEIYFGQNVYNYELEELEVLLFDVTKNDFRYTDQFEKDNF